MSPRPPPVPLAQLPPGYPKLSELVCKDKTLSIFRKFRSLSTRNLLYLQSEILDLESQLQQEDKKLSLTTPEDLNPWQAFSGSSERTKLVSAIRHKLNDYYSTLLQYEKVLNLSCPSYEHAGLLKDWMNCEQPVVDSTKNYLEHRDQAGDLESPWYRAEEDTVDFVSLDPVADSWLSRLLTRTSLRYLFLDSLVLYKNKEKAIFTFSSSKIENATMLISLLLAVMLTVVATIALHYEKRTAVRFGFVGLFTVLVSFVLAICGAKKSELIIGTIGFAAVLVVFVSTQ